MLSISHLGVQICEGFGKSLLLLCSKWDHVLYIIKRHLCSQRIGQMKCQAFSLFLMATKS
jgi:hypothetical protein